MPRTMTTESKTQLWAHYNRANFPHHVANSGPWGIFRNAEGACAAIPHDKQSGRLPSGYGSIKQVVRMIRDGEIAPA